MMFRLVFYVLFASLPLAAETPAYISPDAIKAAISSLYNDPSGNRDLVSAAHYSVRLAVIRDHDGGPEKHSVIDDVFYVLSGHAVLRLGGEMIDPKEESVGEFVSKASRGYREVPLVAGALVSVPRNTVHQVLAKGTEVTYLVIKAH